jgi:hypothetical protein
VIVAITGWGIPATVVNEVVSSCPQVTIAAASSRDIALDVGANGEDPHSRAGMDCSCSCDREPAGVGSTAADIGWAEVVNTAR